MASGSAFNLRSRRGLGMVAMGVVALGAGWYFLFAQSPEVAVAVPKAPVAQPTANKHPATSPAGAQPMPATRPVATVLQQQRPLIAHEYIADPLGPEYRDAGNGFSVRFPDGWAIHNFAGETWVLDCGDATNGLISVGFSPCPQTFTVDQILPQTIARRIKRRPGTELLGQGKTIVAGRKALWSKSTGPLPMTDGQPRMTRVQYIVPLQDGRVLEFRVAAPPEKFDRLAPLFKQVLDSLQLTKRA